MFNCNKTIIKYNITNEIPKIKIITNEDISIKITFPYVDEINISTNQPIKITHTLSEGNNNIYNLFANDMIISTSNKPFDNGTLIITGNCTVENAFF